ncbi:PGF-CTERM sorting domain-containing protein [Natronorubrum sp. JWXQ-INN-674]|uniref:PGF-CTERM sorting domain-containing protein n=1 Tax=Natronorubrum halalkaliphilum TaxID=2691917 RepID=A0A6B0VL16_9EURY|nr:PGF-CTERM sorting domain-containing protein [Natronorubrum halalkaliphilum]MXV61873.1 PGF-CTERM sorting domain-containing protein [Natronorubrum halalkaliphilum]
MTKNSDSETTPWMRRKVLQTTAAGLLTGTAISVGSTPISAEEDETDADDETETDDKEEDEASEEEEEATTCDGSPSMSRTSVTTPNSRITTEDPAVVEANFRPDQMISDDCTIIVDLEFSFTDAGFQWGGGAEWDQATSDLVVGTFEVRPGEVRDIRAELHTQGAEAGDSVTVVADYELWFEGNPEESVQQSGIRHTIEVEEPNPAPEESEDDDESTVDGVPGFGVPGALAGLSGAGYILKRRLTGD